MYSGKKYYTEEMPTKLPPSFADLEVPEELFCELTGVNNFYEEIFDLAKEIFCECHGHDELSRIEKLAVEIGKKVGPFTKA